MRLLHYSPGATTPHSGACSLASTLYFKLRGSPHPPCSLGGHPPSLFPHPRLPARPITRSPNTPTRPIPSIPSKYTIPNNKVTLETYKQVPGKPRKTPPRSSRTPQQAAPAPQATPHSPAQKSGLRTSPHGGWQGEGPGRCRWGAGSFSPNNLYKACQQITAPWIRILLWHHPQSIDLLPRTIFFKNALTPYKVLPKQLLG